MERTKLLGSLFILGVIILQESPASATELPSCGVVRFSQLAPTATYSPVPDPSILYLNANQLSSQETNAPRIERFNTGAVPESQQGAFTPVFLNLISNPVAPTFYVVVTSTSEITANGRPVTYNFEVLRSENNSDFNTLVRNCNLSTFPSCTSRSPVNLSNGIARAAAGYRELGDFRAGYYKIRISNQRCRSSDSNVVRIISMGAARVPLIQDLRDPVQVYVPSGAGNNIVTTSLEARQQTTVQIPVSARNDFPFEPHFATEKQSGRSLFWGRVATNLMTRANALTYCRSFGSDVRLPTRDEFSDLNGAMGQNRSVVYFEDNENPLRSSSVNLNVSNLSFWTSDDSISSAQAPTFDFNDSSGVSGSVNSFLSPTRSVRCVVER